jgi:hypothetical protein
MTMFEPIQAVRWHHVLVAVVVWVLSSTGVSAQFYKQVLEKSKPAQARIMRSIVNSAGEPCAEVTTILFKGADRSDGGYWVTTCSNGTSWMVTVEADGSTSVMSCAIMKRVKVDCWQTF